MLFGERAYWPRLFSSRQPLAAALGHVGGESSARRGGRAPLNTPEPDDGLDATDGLRLYIIGDIHGCSDLWIEWPTPSAVTSRAIPPSRA